MSLSNFFHELRSAYQAELDDLRTDSEGHDVLRKRLAEKRKELGFLLQMMELSPEMVAVVLHQAFRFHSPAAMEHLVAQESDDLPDWASIQDSVEVAPWAQGIVQAILEEPAGAWFMTLAAALEYLLHRAPTSAERAQAQDDEDSEDRTDRDEARAERHDDSHTEDHDEEEAEAQAREEAGNDWLVEQGFDRKD